MKCIEQLALGGFEFENMFPNTTEIRSISRYTKRTRIWLVHEQNVDTEKRGISMAMMPISDYPAPASDKSQAQVLAERKGELKQQLQAVQQSNLPQAEKEHVSTSIRDQIEVVDQKHEHKLREAAHQEKQQAAGIRSNEQLQNSLQQKDTERAHTRHILNVQA